MSLQSSPYILYSDGKGQIFEDTSLYVAGRAGWDAYPIDLDDWIELPNGGSLYELPERRGIGIDVETGEEINLFAENTQKVYQKEVQSYFKRIEATCMQYQIRYVPVSVDEKFEKILLTYLVEKQKFG